MTFLFFFLSSIKLNSFVLTGLDVLERNNFDVVRNKNVGVIVNHTSLNRNSKHLIDLFLDNDIKIKAIFSPEHGFWGTLKAGEFFEDGFYRGIPLYSLYGKTKRPTEEMLKGIETLVFDIQDVGARFYTYLTTMGYAMEEAAKRNIEFIILDRPNPVSSYIVEGALLDKDIKSFTAYFDVPIRHSLTAGEMGLFHKIYNKIDLNLKIVKMEGYKSDMFFDDTGIKWINPSPNIRNLNAAILYSGIGCFEATNISVGRGTEMPFEFFGAPWLDAQRIANELNGFKLVGVDFKACQKIPNSDIYKDEVVNGICISIKDKRKVRAFDIFVYSAYLINKYHADRFEMRESEIAKMTGDRNFYYLIKEGKKPKEILSNYKKQHRAFKKYLKENRIKIY